MKRNSGLDLFRIMCCFGVLGSHVIDDVLAYESSRMLWYACSFCIPGFFMLSGYLLACKESVTVEYAEKKVMSIIPKVFGWVLFWSFIHLARTAEVYDIWDQTLGAVVSSGIEPVAWFLFSYAILLIFAPVLHYVLKKWPIAMYIFSVVCIVLLAMGFGDEIRETKAQVLWLHIYFAYFVLGMTLADLFNRISGVIKYIGLAISAVLFMAMMYIYYRDEFVIGHGVLPDRHYGLWYYTIWVIAMFYMFWCINIKNETVGKIIGIISKNTFTVYLGHLPILVYLTSINPLDTFASGIRMIFGLFIFTEIMAELFKRMPVLRKLT